MYNKIISRSKTGQKILVLSDEEKRALSDYQASGGNVNTYLRKKSAGDLEHISNELLTRMEEDVRLIDSIFSRSDPLDEHLVVYRGLPAEEPSPDNYIAPHYTGTTYELGSSLNEVIRRSNRRIIQEIQLKPGQRAIFIPAYLPFDPFGEKELLLPRDTHFRVLKREQLSGKIVEKVEVID